MNIVADNFNGHRRRIEVLALQFADAAAINSVGPACIKGFNIKMFCAFTDFFVRSESNADIAVGDVFLFEHRHRRHNFGDTGFIIRAEQRFTIGGNQGLPKQLMQNREHHRREHLIADTQRNITTAIVFDNLRIHIFTCEIRCGIDVGNETNGRDFFIDVGRKCTHHGTMIAQRHIHQTHLFHLLSQQPQQLPLPFCARNLFYARLGLCI
ncbi:hypothetical protein D3C75_551800 [compost metagenome]